MTGTKGQGINPGEGPSNLWDLVLPARQEPGQEEVDVQSQGVQVVHLEEEAVQVRDSQIPAIPCPTVS